MIMGALKDIADLVARLIESKEGRKFAAEISKIQSAVASLHSEHAAIIERDTQVMTENLELKRKVAKLEDLDSQEVSALQDHIRKLESELEKHDRLRRDDLMIELQARQKKLKESYTLRYDV